MALDKRKQLPAPECKEILKYLVNSMPEGEVLQRGEYGALQGFAIGVKPMCHLPPALPAECKAHIKELFEQNGFVVHRKEDLLVNVDAVFDRIRGEK